MGYQPQMRVYKGNNGPIPPLCKPAPPPRHASPFQFQKTEKQTGRALSGASFVLYQEDKIIDFAQSDANGTVFFETPAPGHYQLKETCPPPGYESDGRTYQVTVDSSKRITIEGMPIEQFVVSNYLYTMTPHSFPSP